MFLTMNRPARVKRGEYERRRKMPEKYSKRILSFILALLILAAAVPAALFISAEEFASENIQKPKAPTVCL